MPSSVGRSWTWKTDSCASRSMSWTVRCNLDPVNLQVKYGAFETCRSGPWVHLKYIGNMHCIPWHALD